MKLYTTGLIAKMLMVAPRTVAHWFDAKMLEGFRLPGSKDRRIPEDCLIKFMQKHNIPKAMLAAFKKRGNPAILLVDIPETDRKAFDPLASEYRLLFEDYTLRVGWHIGSRSIALVVLGPASGATGDNIVALISGQLPYVRIEDHNYGMVVESILKQEHINES